MALYGVIADIHGNREALSAALALLGNLGAQRIVCLGGFVGYNADPGNSYVKFGYYNWSEAMSSSRKVLLRSPTIVSDPAGEKYGAEQVKAILGCPGPLGDQPAERGMVPTEHPECTSGGGAGQRRPRITGTSSHSSEKP
jgi:hypothetical protein